MNTEYSIYCKYSRQFYTEEKVFNDGSGERAGTPWGSNNNNNNNT